MRPTCAALTVFALAFASSACARETITDDQVVVVIDTDADVPRMFDRVRVRVLTSGPLGCHDCTREEGITPSSAWPLTFGVLRPSGGERVFVHVTFYRSGHLNGAQVDPLTSLETVAELQFGAGVVRRRVFLPMDCVAHPSDLAAATTCGSATELTAPISVAPLDDGSPALRASWHAELARPCSTVPDRADLFSREVCVPGGTFWMGSGRRIGAGVLDPVPEHVVGVSPFYVDQFPFTLGRYRAAKAAGFADDATPRSEGGGCSLDPAARDELPLTCVTPALGAALCRHEGKRLLTEAEWEWMAGSREHEWDHPWGNDERPCALPLLASNTCVVAPGLTTSPNVPVGLDPLDVTIDGVADATGSVATFVADQFARYDAACWLPGGYGLDPTCTTPSPDGFVVRGGHPSERLGRWSRAVDRFYDSRTPAASVGLRCARDDESRTR